MRRSLPRLIVPQVHPMVPKGPSERGFLYKGTNQNKWHQITAKNTIQRTPEDWQHFMRLLMPENWFMGVFFFATLVVGVFGCAVHCSSYIENGTLSSFSGVTGTNSDLFQRNYEMTELLRRHKTVYNQIRAEIGDAPDVLRAPNDTIHWKE